MQKPRCLMYTKQGHIPHLLQPESVGCRLISLEQFIQNNNESFPDAIVTTTDINRLFKKCIKSTQKGIGLIYNSNNLICTPKMLNNTVEKLNPLLNILSDPQEELFQFQLNSKTKTQEQKHHQRFFHFVEQVLESSQQKNMVCVVGTSKEAIEKSCIDFYRLNDSIHGYGIVLPTPLPKDSHPPNFYAEWIELLEAFINNVPKEKEKLVLGVSSPLFAYECLKRGITMIDNAWIERITENGLAFSMKRNEGVFEETWYNFNKDQFEWKLDFDSIDKDCDCWTCCRHSRSYIHHLFCVKDMLGHVMLMHHNLYQMERFMSLVQENVTFRFANT